MNKTEILQNIYDSEINFALMSPCWDGGFTIVIGTEPYGETLKPEKCEYRESGIETLDRAIDRLVEKVVELYPDSVFTQNHFSNQTK